MIDTNAVIAGNEVIAIVHQEEATEEEDLVPTSTQRVKFILPVSRRTRESDLRRVFERYGRIQSIDVKYHGCFAFVVSNNLN